MDFINQMPAFISPSISSRPSSLGNKRMGLPREQNRVEGWRLRR